MSEEEKEAIKELIDSSNLSLIGDGTMIVKNTTIATILELIDKLQKRVDELENHVHYKNCIACGKEFRTKRSGTKYCALCSRIESNKKYYLNLTEEQKAKRREQAKISMRRLRAK